jgi:hypothetical protein
MSIRRFEIILRMRVRPLSARTLSFKTLVMHGVAYSTGSRWGVVLLLANTWWSW